MSSACGKPQGGATQKMMSASRPRKKTEKEHLAPASLAGLIGEPTRAMNGSEGNEPVLSSWREI
jgi:hypothetical protein